MQKARFILLVFLTSFMFSPASRAQNREVEEIWRTQPDSSMIISESEILELFDRQPYFGILMSMLRIGISIKPSMWNFY